MGGKLGFCFFKLMFPFSIMCACLLLLFVSGSVSLCRPMGSLTE